MSQLRSGLIGRGAIRLVEYFRQEAIKIHKLVYGKDIRISMTEQQRKSLRCTAALVPNRHSLRTVREKVGFSKDQVKKF